MWKMLIFVAGKRQINKPISFLCQLFCLKNVIMTFLLASFYSTWDLDKLLGSKKPNTY